MVDDKTYKEYLNKHFNNGDLVWVDKLGPAYEGQRFRARVCGIYAFNPHEMYIIRWKDKPMEADKWETTVMSKACLEPCELCDWLKCDKKSS